MKKIINYLKKNWFISYLLVALLTLLSSIYYVICYLNDGKLIFTGSECFIIYTFLFGVAFISLIVMFLTKKVYNLEKTIIELCENLGNMESNIISFERTTQSIIMRILNKKGDEYSEP